MALIDLFLVLAVALLGAKLIGGLFEKWGIPVVLAELGTGILAGNLVLLLGPSSSLVSVVHQAEQSETLRALAELGALILLFVVGLETDLVKITKVGRDAFFAAVLGVIAPIALAFCILPFAHSGLSFNHKLFLASALAATSVGITARVLKDTKKLDTISGQVILGAAVIDDVLGILVLAIVSSIVTQGHISSVDLLWLLGKVISFALIIVAFRKYLATFTLKAIKPLELSGSVTIILISLCLIAAWGAEKLGLAGIVGAFSLGLALDRFHFKGFRETKSYSLEELLKPLNDFLVPIFFIYMGLGVKLNLMVRREAWLLALILIVCGIAGKLACGFGLSRKAIKDGGDRLLVGVGMIPRGEVGLIFAAMGQRLDILDPVDYGALVMMVAFTTLIAPFLISWRVKSMKLA